MTRTANERLHHKKLLTKLVSTGLPDVHGGENKYSQILYNATSLLIVMLSAHEINFIPLTASGAKIHAKLPLFQSGLGYLP